MTGIHSVRLGSAVLAAALALSACVTRQTYDQLEAEKNREIAALRAEREALTRSREQLEQQIGKLEQERAALENQKVWLNQEQVGLQTRIGLLAQQKEALEQEQAELKRQQAELTQQVEALEQQKAELLEANRQSRAELEDQIAGLEQQKQQLLASSQATESQYNALVRNLTEELEQGQLQVRRYQNMLTVDVAEQLFFDSGAASLKASGKDVLQKVAESLKGYEDKMIRVIGHTDNVPIAKAHQKVYPSNWELSVARATTVVRYLQDLGIPPQRLVASGRAQYAPVADNDTADGRRKNRRIEITLLDRNVLERADDADDAEGALGQLPEQ